MVARKEMQGWRDPEARTEQAAPVVGPVPASWADK